MPLKVILAPSSHRAMLTPLAVTNERVSPEVTAPEVLTSAITSQLKTCVAALDSQQADVVICRPSFFYPAAASDESFRTVQAGGHEVWQAVMTMVKNVSEVVLTSLPNFWRISRAFIEGKFRKVRMRAWHIAPGCYFTLRRYQNVTASTRRSPTQCRIMALDVIKEYISLLSEFFMFSDAAVQSPQPDTDATPPLLPRDSNALTTMHHLMKVLGEIQETVNEVNGMEISSEASSSLKGLLESARWKFEDILIHAWIRGESQMHLCSEKYRS